MELVPEPAVGLVDAPVRWTVDGVPAGRTVRLVLTGVDAAGRSWRSETEHALGEAGHLLVDDPDRPWWSMQPADDPDHERGAPVAFTAPPDTWTVRAEVRADGRTAGADVVRLYRRDVSVDEVVDPRGRWRLRIHRPDAPPGQHGVGVLLVPGSTGTAAMAPTAALLASHGHPTALLAYAQDPGLPPSMRGIPVEVVPEALEAFARSGAVEVGDVVVWAVSVGTALALAALSGPGAPRVRGVVAVSPTDVVWQALGAAGPPPRASSLTRAGADLDWVPMRGERLLPQILRNAVVGRLPGRRRSTALRLYRAYAREGNRTPAVAAATIPVERIAAPVLLTAGDADAMWPAAAMAEAILRRRREHGVGAGDRFLLLPGAGHFSRPPATPTTVDRTADLVSGGTPEGNGHGQRAVWDAALAFLEERRG